MWLLLCMQSLLCGMLAACCGFPSCMMTLILHVFYSLKAIVQSVQRFAMTQIKVGARHMPGKIWAGACCSNVGLKLHTGGTVLPHWLKARRFMAAPMSGMNGRPRAGALRFGVPHMFLFPIPGQL